MSTSKKPHSAFELEKIRDNYAGRHGVHAENCFLNLYKNTYEIFGLNKGSFWDETLQRSPINNFINPIERHRIGIFSKEILNIAKRKTINLLDIGIGNSLIEFNIQKYRNISIFGIDISSYAISKAKQNIIGTFKRGSIIDIPFNRGIFDLVIASEVIEHIPPTHTFKVLSEISRVLKSNGLLLLSVPINENLEDMVVNKGINPNQHARAYTKNIIIMELKLSGFMVYKTHELYAFHSFYWIKSFFIKALRLFKIRTFPKVVVNNLIIFAQKK